MPKPSHTTQDHLIQLIQTNFITPKPAWHKTFRNGLSADCAVLCARTRLIQVYFLQEAQNTTPAQMACGTSSL